MAAGRLFGRRRELRQPRDDVVAPAGAGRRRSGAGIACGGLLGTVHSGRADTVGAEGPGRCRAVSSWDTAPTVIRPQDRGKGDAPGKQRGLGGVVEDGGDEQARCRPGPPDPGIGVPAGSRRWDARYGSEGSPFVTEKARGGLFHGAQPRAPQAGPRRPHGSPRGRNSGSPSLTGNFGSRGLVSDQESGAQARRRHARGRIIGIRRCATMRQQGKDGARPALASGVSIAAPAQETGLGSARRGNARQGRALLRTSSRSTVVQSVRIPAGTSAQGEKKTKNASACLPGGSRPSQLHQPAFTVAGS